MILTINGKIPDWWIEEKPKNIYEWWDNLSWQSYEVPDQFSCINIEDWRIDFWCKIDQTQHYMMKEFNAEWLYKMFANVGLQARIGIDQEIDNIINMVRIWVGM